MRSASIVLTTSLALTDAAHACFASLTDGPTDCPPSDISCFVGSNQPGCNDPDCCQAVCAIDSFCCQTLWDDICAAEAGEFCIGCGNPGAGDCFGAHEGPFCDDVACCELVCSVDPVCCERSWDGMCVAEATSLCAVMPCPMSDHGCFSQGGPGCTDVTCCDAVCADDPVCCIVAWDFVCALAAQTNGACMGCGDASAGNCFAAHVGPYCKSESCCETVCAVDQSCCETQWDASCAEEAFELCATCGEAETGSCFVVHTTGGCNLVDCCELICQIDPTCCESAWDQICVSQAVNECDPFPPACPVSDHGCFEIGGAGCVDAFCCDAVCTVEPYCCVVAWDQICVDDAQTICPATDHCRYSAELITGPCPSCSVVAHDVNDSGQVVGDYSGKAFTWKDGLFTSLLSPPGMTGVEAYSISNSGGADGGGVITGTASVSGVGFRAFTHDGTGYTVLPTLATPSFTFGEGINDQLIVVGAYQLYEQSMIQAVYWQGGPPVVIPTTMPPYGYATAINQKNVVVGWMGQAPAAGESHAFTYDIGSGRFSDLGKPAGSLSVKPYAINDLGDVVGIVYWPIDRDPGFLRRAFIHSDGTWTDLGAMVSEDVESYAFDVNNARQVVGESDLVGQSGSPAVLWQDGQVFVLSQLMLPNPLVSASVARGINEPGQITGNGGVLSSGILLSVAQGPLGDMNLDCHVDGADLGVLLGSWGTNNPVADLDGNGVVDGGDLGLLLGAWD